MTSGGATTGAGGSKVCKSGGRVAVFITGTTEGVGNDGRNGASAAAYCTTCPAGTMGELGNAAIAPIAAGADTGVGTSVGNGVDADGEATTVDEAMIVPIDLPLPTGASQHENGSAYLPALVPPNVYPLKVKGLSVPARASSKLATLLEPDTRNTSVLVVGILFKDVSCTAVVPSKVLLPRGLTSMYCANGALVRIKLTE